MPMADPHTPRGVRATDESGWFWANHALVDGYGPRIGAHGVAVYAVLARLAGQIDQGCHPSFQTIAERLKLSRRQVINVIQHLEACGLIRREPRRDDAGDAQPNRYTLLSIEPPTRDGVVHAVHQVVHQMHHPVHAVHQGGASGAPGVVHLVHPNKTYREQDVEEEDPAPSPTEDTHAPGSDARLTSASPSSERPQHLEAKPATSAVSPIGQAIHTSAAVAGQGDPLKDDAQGRRDHETDDPGGDAKNRQRGSTQATRASAAPETFPITKQMRAWAQAHVPGVNVERETAQFLDYHRARGSVFKDWAAAWRTWMRNAAKFQPERARGRASSSQADMNSARQKAFVQ
jgi:Helix-turn-helix domain